MSPTAPGCLASLDGVIAPTAETTIPVADDGLIRGDGAFEVVRVYDGTPFRFEDHLTRLRRSAENLRLEVDLESVRAEAFRLLAEAGPGPEHETLRIIVTRGGRRLLMTEPRVTLPERIALRTITYAPTRILDGVKSLSYAANMLASRLAREQGADEALLVTPHGRVLEAPTSSLFWVTAGGELLTPPLSDHILASITRRVILDISDAREAVCTLEDLRGAGEAFLASTMREVMPIASVDEHEFPAASPVADELAQRFTAVIAAELPAAR